MVIKVSSKSVIKVNIIYAYCSNKCCAIIFTITAIVIIIKCA